MMRRRPIGVAVFLVAISSIALATTTAFPADRFHGDAVGGPVVVGARPFVPQPILPQPILPQPIVPHGRSGDLIVPHGFFTPPPPSHNVFPRAFFGRRPIVVGVPAPLVVYVWPPGSSESPAYSAAPDAPPVVYDPSVLYDQPAAATVSTAPSPPPTPTVVQYPAGRFELRGDGLTTPYTWVWIPNPPPPPPTPPGPVGALSPGDASPARHSRVYRWTDEQGILHLTDRLDAVPQQFRAQQDQPS